MLRLLLTTGLFLALVSLALSFRLVCYYNRKAAARLSIGRFTPANVAPNLCTHLIFSYATVDDKNNNIRRLVPVDESDIDLYGELNRLKNSNPDLKTLLAVGDPEGSDSQTFTKMVASKTTREKFIDSAVTMINTYGFDGLNLDWRYPTGNANRGKFTSLCQELRAALNRSLLLTASVSGVKDVIDDSYDVSIIALELDFINVLTFGFHDSSEPVTAHHSPLDPPSTDPEDPLTTQSAMDHWKTLGGAALPADKLNMGIAAYSVAFRLFNSSEGGVGAATSSTPPEDGCYTEEPGVWSYYETCLYIQGGVRTFLDDQGVPYVVTEGHWVGYDDPQSLNLKVERIKNETYGGAVVWALDLDDYTGQFCEDGTNPFISYLKSILFM
ncbi:acidic mammalian chitinase-like [Periophthalmus magnuspinnatus]|uniref:acidic mammalian chitinase-like n=1 Tax=Periophthalmus magnuspinnatus TaxID=409849 RepID=UPI00243639A7|nr:acidic mammalian chitinase-like [Periophthalmus magnuspinnatus]